ncbi:MAG: D-glycero-beta-D-manno-heptose 1,7-bisphosphate 7-phosphatase [Pseudomonadota bacterium]
MKRPSLVILDRDGVINADSADYIRSPSEWIPLPGSADAIARLHQAGVTVVIATNQSGIARGYFSRRTLYRIHAKLRRVVRAAGGEIAAIAFCPDGPGVNSECRKPRPGMVLRLLKQFQVSADAAVLIGDSSRDLAAAKAAGVRPWLVMTGNGRTAINGEPQPDRVFDDLGAAVDTLLSLPV